MSSQKQLFRVFVYIISSVSIWVTVHRKFKSMQHASFFTICSHFYTNKQKEQDYTVLSIFYNLTEGNGSSSSHKWRISVVLEKTHAKINHLGITICIDICVPDTILLETDSFSSIKKLWIKFRCIGGEAFLVSVLPRGALTLTGSCKRSKNRDK